MTSSQKTIAIIGATGKQGCSVAKTFLGLPNWKVRCLTRNPSSEKAQTLGELGAEVVQSDLTDPGSLERAFAGAHAIFVNTDYWETFRASLMAGNDQDQSGRLAYDAEVQHGKNAADAASRVSTLERFVYSALGPMKRASAGKFPNSGHWESKAAIVDYIEQKQPELSAKTSLIYLGAYSTNAFLYPRKDEATGRYTMPLMIPKETRFPIIDPESSTGPFVRALVEDEPTSTKLLAYDSYLSIAETVEVWSKVTGNEVQLLEMSRDEMHKAFGVPLEVLEGPAFIAEFGYAAGIDGIVEPAQLKTKVATTSFEDFLKTGKAVDLLQSSMPKV